MQWRYPHDGLPMTMRPSIPGLLLALMLQACALTVIPPGQRCEVELRSVEPAAAEAGESIVVTGAPFTAHYDTAVWVGATRAVVLDVSRTGCGDCDRCREVEQCNACDDCDACDATCSASCVETATIEVPSTDPGNVGLQLYNAYGTSDPVEFEVLGESADTGDTGESGDTAAPLGR